MTSSVRSSPASPSWKPPAPPSSLPAGAPTGSSSRTLTSTSPRATPWSPESSPTTRATSAPSSSPTAGSPPWTVSSPPGRASSSTSARRNSFSPTDGSWTSPTPRAFFPADILRCDSLQELTLDFWTFPSGTEVLLPRLRALAIVRIVISEQELECLIAASPVLESLRLTVNSSKHVRLRSKSLMCALVGLLKVEELTVVDTPLLARLFLFLSLTLNGVRIRIVCAPNLRVLGYLNTGTHELQIGDSVIRPDRMVSTSTVVPSVQILALTVNFGVFVEVKMLASFLRCFPNVDTLHIQSALRGPSVTANEPSGDHHANFWREISPICCLRSHVKKMVIHNFRGDQNELNSSSSSP
uniref:F-box/LRR-repeat protein 15/At3g58940/PEG3-like LRR domain-containing protein n=1 Tax=Triticum urartu TaxID=4572 RepID=A0A8R7R229_TRIUA